MVVAIHQPNYLPWIGYFHKISQSDLFVFLDNVQVPQGRSFFNRNRIKGHQGPFWMTVPIKKKGKSGQLIVDAEIDNSITWRANHWKAIVHCYGKAQCFKKYCDLFERLYANEWQKLIELNEYCIENITKALGLHREFIKASALSVHGSGNQLLINICKAVGADTYLSGKGATAYMDDQMFRDNGLRVVYQDFTHPVYTQIHGEFVPNLSIVDLLLNEGENSLKVLTGG